jgi:hypothetical protein
MTGVTMSKCPHMLHYKCMLDYLNTSGQYDYNQIRMRNVVGLEINQIQCPVCKAVKNTWQPYFPLGLQPDKPTDEML